MIPKEFTLTNLLYEEYKDFVSTIPSHQFYAIEETIKNPKTGNFWNYDLRETYEEDYKHYSEKKIYFIGCSFKIYKKFYSIRLQKSLEILNDAREVDFIIKDYNTLCSNYLFSYSTDKTKEQIEISLRRQREFLEEKLHHLGYIIKKKTGKYRKTEYSYQRINFESNNEVLLDLSNSKLTEKIIYLHTLGILEFLKSKSTSGFSINQIASILSGITGGSPSTIQSYINPIGNPSVSQKNNPMKSEKNVQKVKSNLIALEFNPE